MTDFVAEEIEKLIERLEIPVANLHHGEGKKIVLTDETIPLLPGDEDSAYGRERAAADPLSSNQLPPNYRRYVLDRRARRRSRSGRFAGELRNIYEPTLMQIPFGNAPAQRIERGRSPAACPLGGSQSHLW